LADKVVILTDYGLADTF